MNWNAKLITAAAVGTLGLSALAGSSLLAPPADAFYKQCKTYKLSATGGRKLSNLIAKSSARSAWRATAHSKISKRWSKWLIAKDRGLSCSKSKRKWRCTAIARPCIIPL